MYIYKKIYIMKKQTNKRKFNNISDDQTHMYVYMHIFKNKKLILKK